MSETRYCSFCKINPSLKVFKNMFGDNLNFLREQVRLISEFFIAFKHNKNFLQHFMMIS